MVIELKEPGRPPRRRTHPTGDMLCPVCNVALLMAERQGVEIDYCGQCRGVWLDRGELDKIIERSVAELAPQTRDSRTVPTGEERSWQDSSVRPGKHGKHGQHRGKGKYSRRKSWLSEVFDVFD